MCKALSNYNGNAFASAPAGTSGVAGTCAAGFEQLGAQPPTMDCGEDGEWAGTVTNACVQIKCAATTDGGASWPETPAGSPATQAIGACDSNHRAVGDVPPYRGCQADGTFDEIKNPCIRTTARICGGQRRHRQGIHIALTVCKRECLRCSHRMPRHYDAGGRRRRRDLAECQRWPRRRDRQLPPRLHRHLYSSVYCRRRCGHLASARQRLHA